MPRLTLWDLAFGGGAAAGFCAATGLPRALPYGTAILLACALAGVAVGYAAWWLWVRPIELRERRRHMKFFNICPHCGYRLTGNVSGICPECGNAQRTSRESEVRT